MSQTNWSSKTTTTKSNNSSPQFLKLQNGSNVLRIITAPFEGSKYVVNHQYLIAPKDMVLPGVDAKKQRNFYCGVIVRKTGEVAIWNFGSQVFEQIAALCESAWGSVDNYDIDVVKDPSKGASGYYRVVNMPPKALSVSDLLLQETFDTSVLERFSSPDEEVVLKKLATLNTNGTPVHA